MYRRWVLWEKNDSHRERKLEAEGVGGAWTSILNKVGRMAPFEKIQVQ